MKIPVPSFAAIALLLTVSGVCSHAVEPVAQTTRRADEGQIAFSVMTWNLEWFFDDSKKDNYSKLALEKASPSRGHWNWRRDAVAKSIAEVQPSVVALQEIEGQRVLWYLTQALEREHDLEYDQYAIEGNDRFTEQDVGLLTRRPVDVLSTMRGHVTSRMQSEGEFGSVSKHLAAILEIPVGGDVETVLIVNVHLRSGEAGAAIRAKQAASLVRWLSVWEKTPMHIVVLGDFNTEEPAGAIARGSELAVLMTRLTADPSDDLVDVLEKTPASRRQTHLLKGKQFDRILVSKSLLEDDPGRADLCLGGVSVRRDLAIRGGVDTTEDHWERYWEMSDAERDLSDHYPVIAEFEIR
ncbi:endonuclease/exonuclease/phosphatase family protein [Aporhodopirellula aestuarii]|uniref:Endonuclease/exonuclease/phosphatase family protein n=1 Tax=Aporhodopirellula aestuarii TaxID=2950107 RepID=A0ABT0TXQ2_9BACT|nr:endonuclease/exonuclease/phosphatase family protein [Aporhodopirellula aestuarii]MCM2369366.1 endonuclease/exonuclease/phosphatase family protein [Aporhodopirellula aestuarii]